MSSARRVAFLQLWCALSALFLMGVTYPLWIPLSPTEPFPQIPLFGFCCRWPLWVDWLALGLLVISWVGLVGSARLGEASAASSRQSRGRWAAAGIVASSLLLVCLNQHRLQPWHYQLGIFAAVFLVGRCPAAKVNWLRWLVASIYFYSALSKVDFEFFHTVGPELLTPALEGLGLDAGPLLENPGKYAWRLALLPLLELVIALGLCIPPTRAVLGWLAIALHLSLLLILGPWGLDHSWGVLLWNVHFIGLDWLLFIYQRSSTRTPMPEKERASAGASRGLAWLAVPVMLLPVLERAGHWDHWMSWALYAPHSSRVEIRVAGTAVDRLPNSLQAVLPTTEATTPLWVRLPIDQWSLETLGTPIVPQERFQLGVARYITACVNSEFEIQADLLGPAERLTGKRRSIELTGARQVLAAERYFWFNTRPRLAASERNL